MLFKTVLNLKFLNFFKHKFVIFNIKEEGIENKVLEMVYKKVLKLFFIRPFFHITKLVKRMKNIAIRVSEYEPIEFANRMESM